MTEPVGSALVCLKPPSGCASSGPDNSRACKDKICANSGGCIPDTSSSDYSTCVNGFKSQGSSSLKSNGCLCDNRWRGGAIMDVYLRNNTKETFRLNGDLQNYVIIGDDPRKCQLGNWPLKPPNTILPGTAFMCRASSGKSIGQGDECRHHSFFHACFQYESTTSPDSKFTISLLRSRGNRSGFPKSCPHWNNVVSTSTFSEDLSQSTHETPDRSTATFTIVGSGEGPSGGCTSSPDSCPTGLYCSASASGNTCLSGCKTSPDSCPSGQVCSPSTRACITAQECTTNSDCSLNFICTIPSGSPTGMCTPGCTVNGQDDSSRCQSGFTCEQGQCVSSTNGDDTKLRNELLIAFGVVIFIVIIAGMIYVAKS